MDFSTILTDELSALSQRVQRSLAIVHNGHRGVGAGTIWRRDGLIVTNYHVIAHGRIRVTLADGREFDARPIAQEPEIDLALLQIDARELPAAMVADSRGLKVGQFVLAVGHPWGQRGVITAGLISSLGTAQTRGPRGQIEVIRSDVGLAPGNSGGPLVNAAGAVIGINTMIVGGDLGVAIPSHIVDDFVRRALSEGVKPSASDEREQVVL